MKTHISYLASILFSAGLSTHIASKNWCAPLAAHAAHLSSSAWEGLHTHCNPKNLWDDGTTGINISLLLFGCWSVPLVYNMLAWQWRIYQIKRDINMPPTPENIRRVYKERFRKQNQYELDLYGNDHSKTILRNQLNYSVPQFTELLFDSPAALQEAYPLQQNSQLHYWYWTRDYTQPQPRGIPEMARVMGEYYNSTQAIQAQIDDRDRNIKTTQEKLEYSPSSTRVSLPFLCVTFSLWPYSMVFARCTNWKTWWSYAMELSGKDYYRIYRKHCLKAMLPWSGILALGNIAIFVLYTIPFLKPFHNDPGGVRHKRKRVENKLFLMSGQLLVFSIAALNYSRSMVHWRTTLP